MRKGLVAGSFVALSLWLAGSPPPAPPARQPAVTQEQHAQDREHTPKEGRGAPPPPPDVAVVAATNTVSYRLTVVDAPAEPQEIVATPTAPFSEAPMIVLAVLFLTLLLAGVLQEAFGWLRRVAMEHATEGQ